MTKSKKHILFVSHDASRTGAPIVLLHLLEWLKKDNEYEISIFLKNKGELEAQFKKIARTYLPVTHNRVRRLYLKATNKFFSRRAKYTLPKALQKNNFDLIYLNTVDALRLVQTFKEKFYLPDSMSYS